MGGYNSYGTDSHHHYESEHEPYHHESHYYGSEYDAYLQESHHHDMNHHESGYNSYGTDSHHHYESEHEPYHHESNHYGSEYDAYLQESHHHEMNHHDSGYDSYGTETHYHHESEHEPHHEMMKHQEFADQGELTPECQMCVDHYLTRFICTCMETDNGFQQGECKQSIEHVPEHCHVCEFGARSYCKHAMQWDQEWDQSTS